MSVTVTVTVTAARLPKSADTPRQYGQLIGWDNARVPFVWSDRSTPRTTTPAKFVPQVTSHFFGRPNLRVRVSSSFISRGN